MPHRERTVRPGLHRSQRGCEVVWWSAAGLAPPRTKPHGLRHQELLIGEDSASPSARVRAAHESWVAGRKRSAHLGRLDSISVHGEGRPLRGAGSRASSRTRQTAGVLTVPRDSIQGIVHGVLEWVPRRGRRCRALCSPPGSPVGRGRRGRGDRGGRAAIDHLLLREQASSGCRRGDVCPPGERRASLRNDRSGLPRGRQRGRQMRELIVVEFKTGRGDDETRRYGTGHLHGSSAATGAGSRARSDCLGHRGGNDPSEDIHLPWLARWVCRTVLLAWRLRPQSSLD